MLAGLFLHTGCWGKQRHTRIFVWEFLHINIAKGKSINCRKTKMLAQKIAELGTTNTQKVGISSKRKTVKYIYEGREWNRETMCN